MVNLTERTGYYLCNSPVDLRKGREGLADIVRNSSSYDPTSYDKAFIFYNKKYDTVKILHFDLNGYMILQKWFDDGKLMKPKFMEMKRFHRITREQAMFLLSNAVQSEIYIYDKENDGQRAV